MILKIMSCKLMNMEHEYHENNLPCRHAAFLEKQKKQGWPHIHRTGCVYDDYYIQYMSPCLDTQILTCRP